MTTSIVALSWACRVVAAIILLQTLFFKFTAAPESVYIFTKLAAFLHNVIPFASISTSPWVPAERFRWCLNLTIGIPRSRSPRASP